MSKNKKTKIPEWYLGVVVEVFSSDNGISTFKENHHIRFKTPGFIDNLPNNSQYPIATRMGEPSIEIAPGDAVMIFDAEPENHTCYFYMPIRNNNKIEMFSGLDKKGVPTNHIDLTYAGTDGDNSSKEIYIKSNNKITIECGSNLIVIDGHTGTTTITSRSNSGTGSDVVINGNVGISGDLLVTGEVEAKSGLYALSKHQHFGALAYPITPPIPAGTIKLLR